jgi:hypothetical protein
MTQPSMTQVTSLPAFGPAGRVAGRERSGSMACTSGAARATEGRRASCHNARRLRWTGPEER